MAHLTTPGPLRVVSWHFVQYKRLWRVNVLSSRVQPLIYMLGLGYGLGGLLPQIMSNGALPQDIVHISAARDDEISFDDELKGGLAI